MKTQEAEEDNQWIFDLADVIGKRFVAGDLPPQDDNGLYIL
jgi:hypothetical protein